MPYEHDVFLSHNGKDKPAVEVIAKKLQQKYDLKCWLDKWNLVPGEPWQEALEEALDQCETVAVFVGPITISPWENEEMRAALAARVHDKTRRVIPVLLPGSPDSRDLDLPNFLTRLTWVDFRAGLDDEDALYRLHCGIRGVQPGERPEQAAAPSNSFHPFLDLPTIPAVLFTGGEKAPAHSNPFVFGGRITDPTRFVGRRRELQRIFGALETAYTGQLQHISIVGPRRIGKSSLLYHITQIYTHRLQTPEKYRFVYVDLDDARCHTLDGLLGFILRQLGLTHSNLATLTQFQETMEQLSQKQAIYAVLCLDEFEHLTKRKEQFPDRVFEVWRSIGSNSRAAFVTASQSSLAELIQQGDLTSTFHNIFTQVTLDIFTDEDARALLARNTDRPFTEDEQLRLFDLSGKFPAKLQIAASLLYQAKDGTPVNWDSLKKEYQDQVDFIFGKASPPPQKSPDWLGKTGTAMFTAVPGHLGRFVLDLFGRHEAKDASARMLGWLIIAVGLALLLRLFTANDVIEWFKNSWRFFFPESS